MTHSNPTALWFKNSREPKSNNVCRRKFRDLVLKSVPGLKSLLSERLKLQTQVEKHLKRERAQKKQQQEAFLGCFATAASPKIFRKHSNMLPRFNGYRKC